MRQAPQVLDVGAAEQQVDQAPPAVLAGARRARLGLGVPLGDGHGELVEVAEDRVGDARDGGRARPVAEPFGALGEPLDRHPGPDPGRGLPGVQRPALAGLARADPPPELQDLAGVRVGVGHQVQEVADGVRDAQAERLGVPVVLRPGVLRQLPLDAAHRLVRDAGHMPAKVAGDPGRVLEREAELDPAHGKADHLTAVRQ
ncbi:hypothetical protein GEV43_46340 [Actinomadura sp. J1-007]|nr:hypothetical protein [Actinomadura sp. J1-007]